MAKEQSEGVSGWKITGGDSKGRGFVAKLTYQDSKAGQDLRVKGRERRT